MSTAGGRILITSPGPVHFVNPASPRRATFGFAAPVSISSLHGDITQDSGVLLDTSDLALYAVAGNIGASASAPVVSSAGNLQAQASANAFIATIGNVYLSGACSAGADFSLQAAGNIIANVSLNANNLALATTGGNGSISVGANVTGTNSVWLSTNGSGEVIIGEAATLSTNPGGAISISAGSLAINGAINAGGGILTITPNAAASIRVGAHFILPGSSDFNVTAAMLQSVSADTVVIGSNSLTGGIVVADDMDISGGGGAGFNLVFHNQGDFSGSGSTMTLGDKSFTVDIFGAVTPSLGTVRGGEANVVVSAAAITVASPISVTGAGTIKLQTLLSGQATLGADVGGGASTTVTAGGPIVHTGGTLSANGAVSLTSNSGDIGGGVPGAIGNIVIAGGDLRLQAAGSAAILSAGDISIGNVSVGAGQTFQVATRSGGSIDVSGTITAAGEVGTIALIADGTGNITSTGGTITAAALRLASGSGNIGMSQLSPLPTCAGSITATTAGTGGVYVSNIGDVTVTNSSAGTNFYVKTSGAMTAAGTIFSGNGSLSLIADTGALQISAASYLLACEGNLTIENNDVNHGSITIGPNTTIVAVDTNSLPSNGIVNVVLGPVPGLPVAGTSPAGNVSVEGSGQVYFGPMGISAPAQANKIIANRGAVIFNNPGPQGVDAITLSGGAQGVLIASQRTLAPLTQITNLDFSDSVSLGTLLSLQQSGLVGGHLSTSSGISGNVIITPPVLGLLTSANIPGTVNVQMSGFNSSVPVNVNITGSPSSTSKQVRIIGSMEFIGGVASSGALTVSSNQAGPVLVVNSGGRLSSDGSLTMTVNGDIFIQGIVSAPVLNLVATAGGNIALSTGANVTGAAVLGLSAAGSITQTAGSITGGVVNLTATAGSIGTTAQQPILISALAMSATTGGNVFVAASGGAVTLDLLSSSAGAGKAFQVSTRTQNIEIQGSVASHSGSIGDLTLTAGGGGSIMDAGGSATLIADTITLSAGGSVGQDGCHGQAPILVSTGKLTVIASNGNAAIVSDVPVTLGSSSVSQSIYLASPSISIDSHAEISSQAAKFVTSNFTNDGTVSAQEQSNSSVVVIALSGSLSLAGSGRFAVPASANVVLSSPTSIFLANRLDQTSSGNLVLATGLIQGIAGGTANLSARRVLLGNFSALVSGDLKISPTAPGRPTSLKLAAGSVIMTADKVIIDAAVSLSSTGDVSITTGGLVSFGNGASLTVGGSASPRSVNITTSDPSSVLTIAVPAEGSAAIRTNGGSIRITPGPGVPLAFAGGGTLNCNGGPLIGSTTGAASISIDAGLSADTLISLNTDNGSVSTGAGAIVSAPQVLLHSVDGNLGNSPFRQLSTSASSISCNTGGSVFIGNAGSLNIGTSSAGGQLNLTAGGDITTAGPMSAQSLVLSTTGNNGKITLSASATAAINAVLVAYGSGLISSSSTAAALSSPSITVISPLGSIGSAAHSLIVNSPAVASSVGLTAVAPDGNVFVTSLAPVTLIGPSSAGGAASGITTFELSSPSFITVASGATVTANNGTNLLLHSGGSIRQVDKTTLPTLFGGSINLDMSNSTSPMDLSIGADGPLVAFVQGSVNLAADYFGPGLVILASGNITANGVNAIITSGASGRGHEITLIVGANITAGCGSCSGAVNPTLPSGGDIDFSTASPGLRIDSSSTGGNLSGADVTMIAFANGSAGGHIVLPANNYLASSGSGAGNNGNVTLIAGAKSGIAINPETIVADGGTGSAANTGNISICAAQPATSNGLPVVFGTNGSIKSNNHFIPAAGTQNAAVVIGGDSDGTSSGSVLGRSLATITAGGPIFVNSDVRAGHITIQTTANNSPISIAGNLTGTSSISLVANGTGQLVLVDTTVSSIPVGGLISSVAVNPDATFSYVVNYGKDTMHPNVAVIDNASSGVVATVDLAFYPEFLGQSAMNATGSILYVLGAYKQEGPGAIQVIDIRTNTAIGPPVAISAQKVTGIAINPNGTKVYITGYDDGRINNTLFIFDTDRNAVTGEIAVGRGPSAVAVNLAGNVIYVANGDDNTVSVIDATLNKTIASVPVGLSPDAIAIDQTGRLAYVCNYSSGTVSVIDTNSNVVVSNVRVGSGPNAISINQAGTLAYVTNYFDNTVSVINLATNQVLSTLPVGSGPTGVFARLLEPQSQPVIFVMNSLDGVVSTLGLPVLTAPPGQLFLSSPLFDLNTARFANLGTIVREDVAIAATTAISSLNDFSIRSTVVSTDVTAHNLSNSAPAFLDSLSDSGKTKIYDPQYAPTDVNMVHITQWQSNLMMFTTANQMIAGNLGGSRNAVVTGEPGTACSPNKDVVILHTGHLLVDSGSDQMVVEAGDSRITLPPQSSAAIDFSEGKPLRVMAVGGTEGRGIDVRDKKESAESVQVASGEELIIANGMLSQEDLIPVDGIGRTEVSGGIAVHGKAYVRKNRLALDEFYKKEIAPRAASIRLSGSRRMAQQQLVSHVGVAARRQNPGCHLYEVPPAHIAPGLATEPLRILAAEGTELSTPAAGQIKMGSGAMFVCAADDTIVKAALAAVHMTAGALATIEAVPGILRVKCLSGPGHVALLTEGHNFALRPGQEVLLANHVPGEVDVSPADGVGRRAMTAANLGPRAHAVFCDFSIVTLLKSATYLKNLRQQTSPAFAEMMTRLMKTIAAVEFVGSQRGRYSTHQQQQQTTNISQTFR